MRWKAQNSWTSPCSYNYSYDCEWRQFVWNTWGIRASGVRGAAVFFTQSADRIFPTSKVPAALAEHLGQLWRKQSKNYYRISSYSFRTFMYCDLWPYVLWSLDFWIQKRIVSYDEEIRYSSLHPYLSPKS